MQSERPTTDDLSARIKYEACTIRERLKDTRQDGSAIDRLLATRFATTNAPAMGRAIALPAPNPAEVQP